MIDGVMYVTSSWSKVFALDARTGRELWRFDPKVDGAKAIDACCDVVNRGVAAWGNRVFVGTLDGRLIALDRATGKLAWSVQTTDPTKRYTITGAPRVIAGKVIIGNGGGEMRRAWLRLRLRCERRQDGVAFLYRARQSPRGIRKPGARACREDLARRMVEVRWRRHRVGFDGLRPAARSSLYRRRQRAARGISRIRSNGEGDNLYLSSIVALRPSTGEYVWHFQTTPAESWDFTATQHIILADLTDRRQSAQGADAGTEEWFLYVIDRATRRVHSRQELCACDVDDGARSEDRPTTAWCPRRVTCVSRRWCRPGRWVRT